MILEQKEYQSFTVFKVFPWTEHIYEKKLKKNVATMEKKNNNDTTISCIIGVIAEALLK